MSETPAIPTSDDGNQMVSEILENNSLVLDSLAPRIPPLCPNCGHPIPAKALAAINEKIACGKPAECDYCPY